MESTFVLKSFISGSCCNICCFDGFSVTTLLDLFYLVVLKYKLKLEDGWRNEIFQQSPLLKNQENVLRLTNI